MDIKYIYDQNSKVTEAYDYILKKIETGEYPQGMLLIERKLCAELGMSRTPVRSALSQLASEGELVVYTPNVGMSVKILTEKDIIEIYELRTILDSTAVRRFIASATDENINELKCLTTELNAAAEALDFEKASLISGNIHQYILNHCDNTRLSKILKNLLPHIRYMRLQFMKQSGIESMKKHILDFHTNYFNAISERDEEKAVSVLFKHYSITRDIQIELNKK